MSLFFWSKKTILLQKSRIKRSSSTTTLNGGNEPHKTPTLLRVRSNQRTRNLSPSTCLSCVARLERIYPLRVYHQGARGLSQLEIPLTNRGQNSHLTHPEISVFSLSPLSLSVLKIKQTLSFSGSLARTGKKKKSKLSLLRVLLSVCALKLKKQRFRKMEKKQGFFSALRGLSPSRSRARSRSVSPARSSSPMKALSWGKKNSSGGGYCLSQPELSIGRSGSLRPVMEGPDPDEEGGVGGGGNVGDSKRLGSGLGHWVKGQLSRAPSVAATAVCRRNDLRLLLGVMGAPLAPIHVSSSDPLPHLSIKNTPIVSLYFSQRVFVLVKE